MLTNLHAVLITKTFKLLCLHKTLLGNRFNSGDSFSSVLMSLLAGYLLTTLSCYIDTKSANILYGYEVYKRGPLQ
jgi:hypothetical protein